MQTTDPKLSNVESCSAVLAVDSYGWPRLALRDNSKDFVIHKRVSARHLAAQTNLEPEDAAIRALLEGTGLTLQQAVQLGVRHRQCAPDSPITEILHLFLINRQAIRNNRVRTVDEYRCQLQKFVDDFGHRPVGGITATEIERWLLSPHADSKGRMRTWAASRRNVTRGYIATLFNFGIRKGLCSTNPAAGVDRAIVERAPIEVWTPAETVLILQVTIRECIELLRFLVLSFFSGIRTSELYQLRTEHLKTEQGIIAVPASISKNRKHRTLPISDNLAAWLEFANGRRQPDRIWDMGETSLHRRYRLIEAGTALKWRRNAMRHTYASNHLALHDNEYLTSRACGHTPQILREHYDAVVSKKDAAAHFTIVPSTVVVSTEQPEELSDPKES